MSIPMTNEDRQVELYIYETARRNGYARVPIEKLAIKHSNLQRIRQITTLTPLEKEAQKYANPQYYHTQKNKVGKIPTLVAKQE
jgi:hypothetical protein